jgi:hypothetical protein
MESSFCFKFVSLSYLLGTIISCVIDKYINQCLMEHFYATFDGLFFWHIKYLLSPNDAAISLTVM